MSFFGQAEPNSNTDCHDRLSAELEAAVVRALQRDWDSINWSHLRRALQAPVFLLSDATSRLGQWTRTDRTIEISRNLVLNFSWGVVLEVLKHEMAHQYADEVLGAIHEVAHGPAFARSCRMLGIDPAASGLPRPSGPLPDSEARVLERIAKLLALAQSPNRNEAEAAMREAQRLMLKYNLAVAQKPHAAAYSFRHLGEPTGRIQAHQRQLAAILGRHFFVEPIWTSVHRPRLGKSGSVLEVCGSAANLEMAAHVHDFLLGTAERLWREHRRQQGLQSDSLRRSYLVGVMRGFAEKLDLQSREQQREGLIWIKDAELQSFLQSRYPRQVRRRSAARANPEAFAAGKQAGRSIVLHRPLRSSSSHSGPIRLLQGR